ncbi:TPA: M23 family peptidase [Escherichia coli]|nr:M23 family peptidase [Escherichia coli]
MIISPPFIRAKNNNENDAHWIERMMPVEPDRDYPINYGGSWHGGIHVRHTNSDRQPEYVRAIADGVVVSIRNPSDQAACSLPPLNYNGSTDDGYVLLRHETEIGTGEDGNIVYYSLYMHLEKIEEGISEGNKVYRKSSLGMPGHVDGDRGLHFQIFCDDDNLRKITGRTTPEMDVSRHGRTDVVYGDIYFYLPPGTRFYRSAPENNAVDNTGEVFQSTEPLVVTMCFDTGHCIMTTRRANPVIPSRYDIVGEVLTDADGTDYEYNLYSAALRLYPQSPSAGFELLRFGRVINTEHETLIPANAPLWRTVSYPGGQGVINLAADVVTKFSDGDFPHWSGWRLVDDDADSNSQCNSVILRGGGFTDFRQMICHFPLEWCNTGIEARYGWLKEGVIQERQENEANSDLSLGTDYYRPNNVEYNTTGDSHGESPQSAISEMPDLSYEQSNAYENAVRVLLLGEEDWQTLVKHIKALCFDTSSIAEGRVWHFNPGEFIKHFRKCGWVDKAILKRIFASGTNDRDRAVIEQKVDIYGTAINIVTNKYIMNSPLRRAHFLGQGAVESSRLRSMQEKSQYQTVDENGRPVGGGIVPDSLRDENSDLGHWYGAIETEVDGYFSGVKYNSGGGRIAGSYDWILGNCDTEDAQKFRGRGFKQLTGRSNYAEYWVYRAWIDTNSFTAKWWEDPLWRLHDRRRLTRIPANIEEPHRVTRSEYNCIDTGGFFIVKTVDRRGTRSSITRAMDQDSEVIHLNNTTIDTTDEQTIRSVSRAINGGENGLPDRITFTRAAKKVLI